MKVTISLMLCEKHYLETKIEFELLKDTRFGPQLPGKCSADSWKCNERATNRVLIECVVSPVVGTRVLPCVMLKERSFIDLNPNEMRATEYNLDMCHPEDSVPGANWKDGCAPDTEIVNIVKEFSATAAPGSILLVAEKLFDVLEDYAEKREKVLTKAKERWNLCSEPSSGS